MRAIVVDDEKLALEGLRAKLSHIRCISQVEAFLSPEEALASFEQRGGDIAFLDISMARMDGLTLAARLRERKPGLRIIFVTGYLEYALDALKLHADGYLVKPVDEADIERELDALEQLGRRLEDEKRVRVQCFGDFEIFVDGKPVAFPRSKSKELLAYLVDRRGAACTAAQMADVLWDDGVYDRSRQKQLGVFRNSLLRALRQAGAEHILDITKGALAVLPHTFSCDYYQALAGDAKARSAYTGEYMAAYSWGECTAATLAAQLD